MTSPYEKTRIPSPSPKPPSSPRSKPSRKNETKHEKTKIPPTSPPHAASENPLNKKLPKKKSLLSMSLEEKLLDNILRSYEVRDPKEAKTTSLKTCMSVGGSMESFMGDVAEEDGRPVGNAEAMVAEAEKRMKEAVVTLNGRPVGTVAAMDSSKEDLNYNQVFVRDFVPCGLACLMKEPPETEMVRNFLLSTLHLQGWEKPIDNFTMARGVMPASFKIQKSHKDKEKGKDVLEADFGGTAIGRVSPVDSGFWWIILLHAYRNCTKDDAFTELPEVQNGMKLILDLCLSDGFDTFPTLLCTDGCCMIDRRMGVYGYPIEIQSLFYFALRCAQSMLKVDPELSKRIDKRINALTYHVRTYYWLDFDQLNNIYCYKTEEYSKTAVNKFNVMPDTIYGGLFDFMPVNGGFFVGNVSPARMDFRWFLVGNCIAIISSLAESDQIKKIMDLIEERWKELIGEMPLKVVYPALEGEEWRIVTGCDPKNTSWSYHNGGSWPVLIWLLTAACIKAGRPQIAKRAIEQLETRLAKDGWPEYYDGKDGRYIGKQARKYQTWSIAGYLAAKLMIENPANLRMISLHEEKMKEHSKLTRTTSAPNLKGDKMC